MIHSIDSTVIREIASRGPIRVVRFIALCLTGTFGVVTVGYVTAVDAATFPLQERRASLVGGLRVVQAHRGQALMDLARTYGVGYSEIRQANPDVPIWSLDGQQDVVIPSRFLLPDAPREGIVLNRGEMRLYFFHADPVSGAPMVTTYPVGIGRSDRQTPTGRSRVTMKLHKPTWYPGEEVRADYAARGQELAFQVPPGPANPLGEYALVLDKPGYLLHGTNRPDGIGMQVSQGCVRLYPEDIKALVDQVKLGTPVIIVDQPYKVGISGGRLFLEVHPRVYPEETDTQASQEQLLVRQISQLLDERGEELQGRVDWNKVTQVLRRASGIPTVVSRVSDTSPSQHVRR